MASQPLHVFVCQSCFHTWSSRENPKATICSKCNHNVIAQRTVQIQNPDPPCPLCQGELPECGLCNGTGYL